MIPEPKFIGLWFLAKNPIIVLLFAEEIRENAINGKLIPIPNDMKLKNL